MHHKHHDSSDNPAVRNAWVAGGLSRDWLMCCCKAIRESSTSGVGWSDDESPMHGKFKKPHQTMETGDGVVGVPAMQ